MKAFSHPHNSVIVLYILSKFILYFNTYDNKVKHSKEFYLLALQKAQKQDNFQA